VSECHWIHFISMNCDKICRCFRSNKVSEHKVGGTCTAYDRDYFTRTCSIEDVVTWCTLPPTEGAAEVRWRVSEFTFTFTPRLTSNLSLFLLKYGFDKYYYKLNAIFPAKKSLFIDNSTEVFTSFRITEHSDRTGQIPEALLGPVTVVSCVSAELTNSWNT